MATNPLIYIIAGEPSGDLLGAKLMAALRAERCGEICFSGIGGENMISEGLNSLFDLSNISTMGFLEVLPHARLVLQLAQKTVTDIVHRHPHVLVTIDSWGFTGMVNRTIRSLHLSIPQIHYVAPMVWVWRERRVRRFAGCIDHLMTLFSHEPAYFERAGVVATCVGHPIIESGAECGDGLSFRRRYSILATTPLVCMLPGSRHSEVKQLLPVLGETASLLASRQPGLQVVVPTVATVAELVAATVAQWSVPALVVYTLHDKYDAFAAADVALTASGTVALELALAGLPMVVTYRVAPLSAWLFRRLSHTKYINLVNLLLDRSVVPELLQERCHPAFLAEEIERLFNDTIAQAAQRLAFQEVLQMIGYGSMQSPSLQAARLVLDVIGSFRSSSIKRIDCV